jgi:hypothetical protein
MKPTADEMPDEIDFSNAQRGVHSINSAARVFVPASIEEGVWKYFSAKAAKKGVDVADLLTEVLRRDIEINEALR